MGERSKLGIGQLTLGSHWNPHPSGLRRLLWELVKRTSVQAVIAPAPLAITDPKLFDYPLLWLSGDAAIPPLSDREIEILRRHLRGGGTLIVDAAEAAPGAFAKSVRREIARVFPGESWHAMSPEHVVFKSFYLVDSVAGRILARGDLEAIEHDDRALVIFSSNDLAGAWARDALGSWENAVEPGGEKQREMSFRLGINLMEYALCGNYKRDQVHAPYILKRRMGR